MIFAHAPAGFLASYLYKKNAKWLYIAGIFGGLFPDIDLIYYYLFSATFSHHQAPTHAFFPYLIICFLIWLIGYFIKKDIIKQIAIFFLLGVATHLCFDSIGAGVVWLYPFSSELYGLMDIKIYYDVLGEYFFTINYSIEIIVFTLFFLIFIKKKSIKIILLFLDLVLIISLIFINLHLFRFGGVNYSADSDKDGILNRNDFDLDGDGILNINDLDIDNNGQDNQTDLVLQNKKIEGVWYDISEGGLLEIPLRMGFTSNTFLITRIYDNLGIYFKDEMMQDYKQNQQDYKTDPASDTAFDRNIENWQAWLTHVNKIGNYNNIKTGDILFFKDNTVAIFMDKEKIITASKDEKKVIKTNLNNLQKQYGPIKSIGRVLP